MSQGDTPITMIGNLTADPELQFTPAGDAVAKLRIASTPRVYDKNAGRWADGDPLYLDASVWRAAAENAAESLVKGMRVIVTGTLHQRTYENRDGQRRTVYEIRDAEVGPSLKFAAANVTRNPRGGAGSAGGYAGGGAARTGATGGGFGAADEAPF